jgi:hypothetical protein
MGSAKAFLRPGTNENAFTYVDPGVGKMNDVKDPFNTAIGELDAGYGWKVVIYPVGITKAIAK